MVTLPCLLGLVALTTSCIGSPLPVDPETPGEPADVAASLSIEPDEPVLLPGQSIRFHATVRDADGDPISGDVAWESEDGLIRSDGLYTAGEQPGRRKIKARHTKPDDRGPRDSTWVRVADPQAEPVATHLELTPASATLESGSSVLFEARLYADDGSQVAGQIDWSATGGTIDETGLYTASSSAGQYEVLVASGSLTMAADVTIEAAVNQPPVAVFDATCDHLACAFDASASSDTDGDVVGFDWHFGDENTASGSAVQHTFDSAGTYSVVLEVVDDDGTKATETLDLTVEAPDAGNDPAPEYDVSIEPGESIQAAVNANPQGTTFLLRSGMHRGQQVDPKQGNTFVGEDGAVMHGDSTLAWAIRGDADDVTIRNLKVVGYMPPVQWGAIEAEWDQGLRWTIEDVEVAYNASAGIKVGHDMVIRRVHVHHNGQIGLLGRAHRLLVEDSEISYNNVDGHDPLWEAGGMKFLRSDGVVFRNNHVHNNHGIGVWFDHDNINSLIESNRIEDNEVAGIHYEISFGATIRYNEIHDNGEGSTDRFSRAGILVYVSKDVEIYGNTLSGNDQGIVGLDDARSPAGEYGPFAVENLWVHDNDVTMQRGGSGLYDWRGTGDIYDANNRFDNNVYRITGNDLPFWHGGRIDEGSWQARGQDVNGTFIR